MSEFPDSGEISVRGIRNFLSSYIQNLSNDNVKDLFAAMQAEDFNLPNADVIGGNSQAFIEPHKLSETYGMYANKKFIGFRGDRITSIDWERGTDLFDNSMIDSRYYHDMFPVSVLRYLSSIRFCALGYASLFEFNQDLMEKAGMFSLGDPNYLDHWQVVNQSTDVSLNLVSGQGLQFTVNNQSNNPGISISIDTVPGYTYQVYIGGATYHNACTPKIVVGTTLNAFDILNVPFSYDSRDLEFIASTNTTYIRISSDHTGPTPAGSADYIVYNIVAMEMNDRYADVDVKVYDSNNGNLPLVKNFDLLDSDQYGNYRDMVVASGQTQHNSAAEAVTEDENIGTWNLKSSAIDSNYSDYGNILSYQLIGRSSLKLITWVADELVSYRRALILVPIDAGPTTSYTISACNIEAICTRFCEYGISKNTNGTYNLIDSTGSTVVANQSKSQALSAWQDTVDNGFYYAYEYDGGQQLVSDWTTAFPASSTSDTVYTGLADLLSMQMSLNLMNDYGETAKNIPYSLISYVGSDGTIISEKYPLYTALPRYSNGGDKFFIQTVQQMNLDSSILSTIQQAISTLQSIIQTKSDFKLVILPYFNLAPGGTLAAAGTLARQNHGLYDSTRQLIYSSVPVEYDSQELSCNSGVPDTSRFVNNTVYQVIPLDDIPQGTTKLYHSFGALGVTFYWLRRYSNAESRSYVNIHNDTYRIESIQSDTEMTITAPTRRAYNSSSTFRYYANSAMPSAAVGYKISNLEPNTLYDIEIKIFGLNSNVKFMLNIWADDPIGNFAYRTGYSLLQEIDAEKTLIAENVSTQSGSDIVNGVATNFTDQLTVGEKIFVDDDDSANKKTVSEIISDTQFRVNSSFTTTHNSKRLYSQNLKRVSFIPTTNLASLDHILEIQYFPATVEIMPGFAQINGQDTFFSTTQDLTQVLDDGNRALLPGDQVIVGRTISVDNTTNKVFTLPQLLTVDDFETTVWTNQDDLPPGINVGDVRYKVYFKEDPTKVALSSSPYMNESIIKYSSPSSNYGIDKISDWGPRIYKNDVPLAYPETRDLPSSGVMYLDTIDMYNLNNIIVHDNKTQLYYVVLHELWHAVGMGGSLWELYNLKSTSGYPTQYFGEYAIAAYQTIVANKLAAIGENVTDYYIDTVPAQGSSTHIAEYAKIVNNKIQPSLKNELMTPQYNEGRGIISAVSIGLLEDLGWTVDYSLAESADIIDLSTDTSINSNPGNNLYDELQLKLPKKKRRTCSCCRHIDCNESDN